MTIISRGDRLFPDPNAPIDPERPALIMAASGARLSYIELDAASRRLARLLQARGLSRGDHVALVIENSHIFHVAVWACQRSGLYYTPVNTRLTAAEAEYIISDCGAKALLASSSFPALAGGLHELLSPALFRASVHDGLDGYERLETLMDEQSDRPLDAQSEGSSMLYSSGTTGRPKGIKRPMPKREVGEPDLFLSLLSSLYGFDTSTVYLCPTPTYHGAGLWYSMAMQRLGASCVVMEKFTPEGFLSAVERYGVTHTQVVPTMFSRLLKLSATQRTAHDLSSLKAVIHAAAPCPISIKEDMIRWLGPIIHEYFAATEGNGYTHVNTPEWLARKGTVGRAVIGEIHIVDDHGVEQSAGTPGLVYFGGLSPFAYHNDGEKTAASRHPSGWTTTGDIGRLDEEGYLYLTDRKAFTIISGGVNIYPREVEDVLAVHPDVMDVAVFGIPDPDMGEQVKAVVQLADPSQASEALGEALVAYCRERLAHYKCPRSIDFMDELPRGDNGKLYKRPLRNAYWQET